MNSVYMSTLADAIQGFVREREALGYRRKKEAVALKRFDRFYIEMGHNDGCLPGWLAMRWAEKRAYESDDAQGRRIRLVRMLARYMARSGYDAYIYPARLGVIRSDTYQPYLFTEAELAHFLPVLTDARPTGGTHTVILSSPCSTECSTDAGFACPKHFT